MHTPDLRANLIDDRISPFLREAHLSLLDVADLRAGSRTLILECRDGWAAEEAWRRVGPARSQVIGVDVSDRMIELAKRYREVPDRLEFRTWNQRTLPFGDDSFDTVISTFSLHRYDDPERVLSEAARVLTVPRGKVLVLEPLKYSFGGLYVLVDWFYRLVDPGHVRYYTRSQLTDMLERTGFDRPSALKRVQGLRRGGKLLANALLLVARKSQPDQQPK